MNQVRKYAHLDSRIAFLNQVRSKSKDWKITFMNQALKVKRLENNLHKSVYDILIFLTPQSLIMKYN
jgi:hypothetical protein